jgi:hypothetical protein
MDEPRDEVDTWLHERVKPLLPPPGAFEAIRRRARRRRLAHAVIAAGGAAVIVAAAATVPPLIIGHLRPTGATNPVTSAPTSAAPTRSATPSPAPSPTPSPAPSAAGLWVPPNFAVSSVTFVSARTGWVIGQAGIPGQCTGPNPNICTSLAGTSDGGQSWHGIPAPVAGAPDGGAGVSQIRSLDGQNGWAFGPQLYATHDGGHTWTKIGTHGMRVTGLETVAGRAFAVWARCTGTGPDFAGDCTSFSLYSSPAGTDAWAPVPGVTGLTSAGTAAGVPSSAQLVLTGSRGYLLAPDGFIYSGPVTGTVGWQAVTLLGKGMLGCDQPGPAQADGTPADTMLAATGTGLVELCLTTSPGQKLLAYSADGGRTWMDAGSAPGGGTATSLSGTPAGQVLVATTSGIDVSANVAGLRPGGLRWRSVLGAAAPGGYSYVGMTTASQGVAVPAETSLHAVWFTYDGGRHWQESPIP